MSVTVDVCSVYGGCNVRDEGDRQATMNDAGER